MARVIKLKPINEEFILDRLRFENPWWTTRSIDSDYEALPRRPYFNLLYPLIEDRSVRRAVVMMGPRRVGKTVMIHHAIAHLIKTGHPYQNIGFIAIDNPIYLNLGLEQLLLLACKAAGKKETDQWFVFFDEIQYLKNWELHLKVLVDRFPHIKFVVSGSAAAALKLKSTESGAGRFTEFMLPPITFHEYIFMKGLSSLMHERLLLWAGSQSQVYTTFNYRELNKCFLDYINFGGYPEVIFSERIQLNPGRYIKGDIIDKVLLRDLPSLYGIQDVQQLNAFFSTLTYYSGNEVSLESLSNSSGVEKNLLKKYLEYLEAAFLIRVVHRIDDNSKKFQRATAYKIFLTNPSLRSALFSPLEPMDDAVGAMVETAIFSQWLHREWFTPWYARWSNGGEVDMVGLSDKNFKPLWAVEIKWTNRYYDKPASLGSLIHFCKRNNLKSALVTTVDKEGVHTVDGVEIAFVPAAAYAYLVGVNTLDHKKRQSVFGAVH